MKDLLLLISQNEIFNNNNPHLQNVKANLTGINSKPFNGLNKNSYKSYFYQDM